MKTKLILTALTTLAAGALYAADVPPVGSAAPDFSAPDANGKTQKLQEEYTGKGVVWLTVDSNAPGTEGNINADQAKKIMDSWKTKQTALVLDPESKIAKLYGAKNTPNMVIINPEGKIVYEGAIDSKASPNPADIPSSTNYVKSALDESLAGKPVSNAQTKPYGCSVKYKSS